MNLKARIGLIILAAGASVRMGAPKQLLLFEGETLLRRAVREGIASICQPVVVVLGKDAEMFEDQIKGFGAHLARNPDWEQGMGTSIRAGIETLSAIDKECEAAILAVCDQPFMTSATIDRLAESFLRNRALIVASAYAGTRGVPALFSRKLFPELLALKGSGGAKEVIRSFPGEVVAVDFPEGAIDIDTTEDFRRLEELSANDKQNRS